MNVLFVLYHEKYVFNQKILIQIKKKIDIICYLFVQNK